MNKQKIWDIGTIFGKLCIRLIFWIALFLGGLYGAYYYFSGDMAKKAFDELEGFPLMGAWLMDLSPLILSVFSFIKGFGDFMDDKAEAIWIYHVYY